MAVKIRLMRVGKKKQPAYRIVVADARSPRDGRFIEILGQYQPREEPSVVELDTDRAVQWLRNGAQPTDEAAKLFDIAGVWDAYKAATGRDASGRPKPRSAPSPAAAAARVPSGGPAASTATGSPATGEPPQDAPAPGAPAPDAPAPDSGPPEESA